MPYPGWRAGQRWAIRTSLHTKTPHVVVNAPTGSGKTAIAGALAQLDERRSITLTATKALMTQYTNLLPWLFDVRGMGNYECLAAKDEFKRYFPTTRRMVRCDDGPCHSGEHCSLKEHGCTYYDRVRGALGHRTVLSNYSFLLSTRRFGKGLGVFDRFNLDEAHALAEQLMAACRIEIPLHLVDLRRMPRSAKVWRGWAESQIAALAPGSDHDSRMRRERATENFRALALIDETWAWDKTDDAVVFEPTIPRLLLPLLGPITDSTVVTYLSATITPAHLKLLDIDAKDITFESLPSHFPIDRRPVYLVAGARVDYRSMQSQDTVDRWIASMDRIIDLRDDRKGLIHTVSYGRQYEILKLSRHRDKMIAPRAGELADAVEHFRSLPPSSGAVLVSPAIMTGYDFPDDDARYQILAKVPFPDTRSNIMQARMANTPGYRDTWTMTQLVQACGRINRSDSDWGETFIVDQHARWFLERYAELAPQWFLDSIVQTRRVVKAMAA